MQQNIIIPIAIVIAGALVAGAVIFSGSITSAVPMAGAPTAGGAQVEPQPSGDLEAMRPIDDTDYIKGDPNAPIKIVEYSDFECPFCKRHHATLNNLVEEYIDTGRVAWVYRQSPIEQLHPVKAMAAAVASECVGELAGNEAFWQFTDGYFERSPSNNQTDIDVLIPELVAEIGVDQAVFEECYNSDRHDAAIAADIENGFATGGQGTPWSILVAEDGTKYPINGAQPQAAIEQLISVAENQ